LLLKLQAEKEYAEGMANLEEAAIKAINEKVEALKREAEALKREAEAQKKFAIKMKKYGEPIEEIIKETGLSKEEIEKL